MDSGLGFAKLLGHQVDVRSWPDNGSVFAVNMPITSATSVQSSEVLSEQPLDIPLAAKLIAVIDDNDDVSVSMASLLESWGATAVCASNGDELLRVLSGRRPDAVIADCNLGTDVDGFMTLNQLEAFLGGTLPSLILTGDYAVGDQDRADRAGRRVLHKPVWDHTLLAALRFELSRSGQM